MGCRFYACEEGAARHNADDFPREPLSSPVARPMNAKSGYKEGGAVSHALRLSRGASSEEHHCRKRQHRRCDSPSHPSAIHSKNQRECYLYNNDQTIHVRFKARFILPSQPDACKTTSRTVDKDTVRKSKTHGRRKNRITIKQKHLKVEREHEVCLWITDP